MSKPLPAHLLERVKKRIHDNQLEDIPFLVAVSGGADSMACATILRELSHPLVGLAFCDHGLRPISDEKNAVFTLAKALELPVYDLKLGLSLGPNLQARAREARYESLFKVLPEGALLATGHTLSDQAETVLQRLIRGSGIAGLAGLYPHLEKVVRPILDLTRDETRSLDTGYVDDPTNETPLYQRNRIRQFILPLLKEENPAIEYQLAQLAEAARGQTALLDMLVAHLPDLSHEGLSPEVSTTFLHHLSRIAGITPSREALFRWAQALQLDLKRMETLGDDLVGLSVEHRARFMSEQDPRRAILIQELGMYHFRGLTVTVESRLSPRPASHHCVQVPQSSVLWPIRLQVLPSKSKPTPHTKLKALCRLTDASGRDLFRYQQLICGLENLKGPWLCFEVIPSTQSCTD